MFESGAVGQISFVSEAPFVFGSEFSVLGPSEGKSSSSHVRVVCADMSPAEVRIEGGKPLEKRYVVVTRKTNGTKFILYEAFPVDSIVEEAESIEREVVARLQAL